jgi:hypothetical protein
MSGRRLSRRFSIIQECFFATFKYVKNTNYKYLFFVLSVMKNYFAQLNGLLVNMYSYKSEYGLGESNIYDAHPGQSPHISQIREDIRFGSLENKADALQTIRFFDKYANELDRLVNKTQDNIICLELILKVVNKTTE